MVVDRDESFRFKVSADVLLEVATPRMCRSELVVSVVALARLLMDKWERAVEDVVEMSRLDSQRAVVILCSPRCYRRRMNKGLWSRRLSIRFRGTGRVA